MKVRVVAQDVAQIPADALVANLFQGVKTPGGATAAVDRAMGGAVSAVGSRSFT